MRYGTHVAEKRKPRLDAYILLNESKYDKGAMVPIGETKRGLKTKQHRHTIDLAQVEALAQIGCTMPEMAKVLGCSVTYIERMQDENPAFALALERGEGSLKSSLRRSQLKHAFEGNASLLIWLGKQYLGQVDKREIDTKSEVNVVVQKAREELAGLPQEQLLEMKRLLSMPVIEP